MISAARLNALRTIIIISAILMLLWGAGWLLFPQQLHESVFPVTKAPFNPVVQANVTMLGASVIAWAVASVIAFRDPLKNLGLIQALIVAWVLVVLGLLYVLLVVDPADATPFTWGSLIVNLIITVLLIVAYPRGQAAS